MVTPYVALMNMVDHILLFVIIWMLYLILKELRKI